MKGPLDLEHALPLTPDEAAQGVERSFSWTDSGTQRTITVRVPAGVAQGTRLRMAGLGTVGKDGAVGDLYLRIEISRAPRSRSESATASRMTGAFLLALGLGLGLWLEHTARTEGHYYVQTAFLGPFLALMGVGMLIHAPRVPVRHLGLRDSVYALAGAACGIVNLHRYGALEPGSPVRMPILFGFGAVALYSLYNWARRLTRE